MKRKLKQSKFLLIPTIVGAGLFIYAWQVEPYYVEYVEMEMEVENLPIQWQGKTIMHISDTHIGDRFDYQYLIETFTDAQQFEPDIVVYTGDFLAYNSPKQFQQLEEVAPYFVKGKEATIGVLGNHDYGKRWKESAVADQISNRLESAGIEILRNESLDVDGLTILGIDDYYGTNFDGAGLLKKYDPTHASIVLNHNPDVVDLPIWNGYQGWILSGHTHGGQVKIPFFTAPILPLKNRKYASGKVLLEDGRIVYVNRGIGHTYPIRFNVRPEITLFTLKSKKI